MSINRSDHRREKLPAVFDGQLRIIAGFGLALLAAGFLLPLPNAYRANWLSCLMDVLHAPAFALITISLRLWFGQPWHRTVLLAGGVALLTEVVQAGTGRSMSLKDLVYDGLGVIAAVFILWPADSEQRVARYRNAILAIAFLVAPLALAAPVLIDASLAVAQFPVLAGFSSRWETERWYSGGVRIRRALIDGNWRGEIDHPTSADSGSAVLFPVVRNWSAYEMLWCEFSFTGPPTDILISVRDANGRVDICRKCSSGTRRIGLNLRDPVSAGHTCSLDLTRIQSFHFALRANSDKPAFIHSVYLE